MTRIVEKAYWKVQLKRSHKYFYQIPGQIFCAQLKKKFWKRCMPVC